MWFFVPTVWMINLAIIRNIFIDSVMNTDIAMIVEISECKQVLVYAVLFKSYTNQKPYI